MTTPVSQSAAVLLRRWWPLLIVVVPCILLAFGGEPLREALRYDREAILGGAWWRLFSGNFVHLGWGHLAEDMAGCILLWLLFEDVLPTWQFPLVIAIGALGVGIGLLAGDPELHWYVGISGALNTIWILGAMRLMQKGDGIGWLLGLFLLAKLIYEQALGPLPWSETTTGGAVVVDAHLYGAFAGALIGLSGLVWRGARV
ncbi:MAG: rhombosortase [Gammaproteobacteria bacterium]